jgi:hypothetical protein
MNNAKSDTRVIPVPMTPAYETAWHTAFCYKYAEPVLELFVVQVICIARLGLLLTSGNGRTVAAASVGVHDNRIV